MRRSSFRSPGIRDFLGGWDGVQVGCVELNRHIDARCPGVLNQSPNQFGALIGAFFVNDLVERLKPFRDFLFRIRIRFRLNRKLNERVQGFVQRHSDL